MQKSTRLEVRDTIKHLHRRYKNINVKNVSGPDLGLISNDFFKS